MTKVWALVAAVALVAIGCFDSPSESEPRRPTPEASVPEFVNGGECVPDDTIGADAGCVTSTHNDDASLFVYAIVGEDSRPKRWRIRLDSDEGEIDEPLKAGNPFSYPRALAAIDVNGDGTDEWVIKNVDLAGHGTNWQRLEIFVVEGDDLVPVTLDDELLFVNVGGTSRLGEGARCDGEHFVLLRTEAENRQNTVWSFSERMFEIRGSEATYVDRRDGKLQLSDYNDPQLDPYYRITCGEFLYP